MRGGVAYGADVCFGCVRVPGVSVSVQCELRSLAWRVFGRSSDESEGASTSVATGGPAISDPLTAQYNKLQQSGTLCALVPDSPNREDDALWVFSVNTNGTTGLDGADKAIDTLSGL